MYDNNDDLRLMLGLHRAYLKARLGKRGTVDEQRFERCFLVHLAHLADEIESRTYVPSRGIAFVTHKPVTREIFAAPFRDRVVHHLLFDMVGEWWDRRFIYDNYSCRKGKGTLFGVRRLYRHMASVSESFTRPAYVLKLDIQGYFMSLPRDRLFETVMWGLDRQFEIDSWEYKLCKFLWWQIIYDDPTKGVEVRGSRRDWRMLPRSKSLFYAAPGRGIVIGNLTSQLLSNIYLDKLDRFVTMEMGWKHYGRYVDDFYFVGEDRVELVGLVPKIEEFLSGLGLKLHPRKRYLQEISRGVPFLGAVVYPYRMQPGRRLKRNFVDAARKCEEAGWELLGKDDPLVVSMISYLGHVKHFRNRRMIESVGGLRELDYLINRSEE